jgi:NAD(P)-dependent dehydrogenase (short-subunit alcohol dehydrogenase family)
VAINYSRSEQAAARTLAELEGLGGDYRAIRADVSDDAAVAAMTAAVGDAYSHPSVTGETVVVDGGYAATT